MHTKTLSRIGAALSLFAVASFISPPRTHAQASSEVKGGDVRGGDVTGGTITGGGVTGGAVTGSSVQGGSVTGGSVTGGTGASGNATTGIATSGTVTAGKVGPATAKATVNGREITAKVQGSVSIQTQGSSATVDLGAHKVAIESDHVKVDGKERAKLPANAEKIAIESTGEKLTIRADGSEVLAADLTKLE